MARVPTYDAPTVAPTVGGQPAFRSVISEGAATLPGRQMQEAGLAIQKAGVATLDIATKAAMEANKLRLNDAYNRALNTSVELKTGKDGFSNLRGAAAVTGIDGKRMSDVYTQKLQDQISQIGEGLDNDALKAQWGQVSGQLAGRFHAEALAHEGEQVHVWTNEVNKGITMASANAIAADPLNPTTVAFHAERARIALSDMATDAGFDGEPKDLVVQAGMGKLHSQVIDGMIESNPMGAKAYFEAHKTDYSVLDAKVVGAKIMEATAGAEAVANVDTVLAKFPPALNQPWNAEAMDAELRDIYKDDAKGLKSARSELAARQQAHESTEDETNTANVNTVGKLFASGMSMSQVRSSPAWLSLPGKLQQDMAETEERRAYARAGRMTADADRARIQDERRAYASLPGLLANDRFMSLSDDTLAAMSLQGKITPSMASDLIRAKKAGKDGRSPWVTDDEFAVFARSAGVDPLSKNKDEIERAAYLRYNISLAIQRRQENRPTPLTAAERSSVALETAGILVTAKPTGSWANPVVSAATMAPERLSAAGVPPAKRAEVAKAMERVYKQTGNPQYKYSPANLDSFYRLGVATRLND